MLKLFVIYSPAIVDLVIACGNGNPSKIGTTEVIACPVSTTKPVVEPVLNRLKVAEFINKTELTFKSSNNILANLCL